MSAPPFPLGVFTGNPGDGNAVAQFNNFAQLIGAVPPIINVYIDGTVNPDTWQNSVWYWVGVWAANAPWNAGSPTDRTVIPMWGMPMGSLDTTYTPTQILQRYVAGTYDGYLNSIVSASGAAGYKTILCRPGVEMNLTSTPGFSGYYNNPALWIEAFQHISTVLHAAFEQYGVSGKVIWNPGVAAATPAGNATLTLWPGKQYVDVVGIDTYADLYPWGPLTDQQILSSTANMEHYYSYPAWNGTVDDASNGVCVSLLGIIAFAKAQWLPIAICETGAGGRGGPSDNPVWWQWLRPNLDAAVAQGVPVEFVSFWNANGGGSYQFTGGQQPNASNAIAANFGVNAPPVAPPHAASAAGTQLPLTTIYDTNGTAWTLPTIGGQIYRNGTPVPSSAGVVALYWDGNGLDQLNNKGVWWTQPLDGSAGVQTTAPAGYVPP